MVVMSERFSLRVPSSTSNLGPGFDFLGLCLGLFLEAEVEVADGHRAPLIEWTPAATWPAEEDLVLRALSLYAARFGVRLPALTIRLSSEIPVGRGFGSSGAATAAGLLIAAEASSIQHEDRTPLVELAIELEGHPDNAAASLLGGCALAVPHDAGLEILQQPVHDSLGFAVAWPSTPLFTEQSRAVLPETIPFQDAVENPRRLALLLDGLRTGDPTRLRLGVHDRLHERFRRVLIPGADAAIQAALEAGAHAACLSGAGSGLVAIGPQGQMEAVCAALSAPLEGGGARVVPFEPHAPKPFRG